MTTSNILNIIGLCFDIIGVIMLFKFGLPPEINKNGTFGLDIGYDPEEKRKADIYTGLSYVALIFLILGFILQILANIFVFKT